MKKGILFNLFVFGICTFVIGQTSKTVSNFEEFKNAVSEQVETIILSADIVATSEVSLSGKLVVKGNGHTYSVEKPGVSESGLIEATPTSGFRLFTLLYGADVTLEGMTLMGGAFKEGNGGIVSVSSGAKLNINNSELTRTIALTGGAIINAGALSMKKVIIRRNFANAGGAIYNIGGAARLFADNIALVENRTLAEKGSGGALYNYSGAAAYFNNATISNNQANYEGGAISNVSNSSAVYLTNTTGTGNLVLSEGVNGQGGFAKNNGGIFQVVNSVLAYNYYSPDNGNNFELEDFTVTNSLSGLKIYYSLVHGDIIGGIGANVQNIEYDGMADGSDNSIFSGGLLSKADSLGFERGTGQLFRPYLWEEDGTVYTPLKFGSELLEPASAGTATRFGLANGVNCAGFSTSEFTRNGTGTIINSNTVRLTQARGRQSGSVWANDKVDLREDFSVEAEIYLGTSDRGADGIAFVFQPLSVNAGSSGGGLGYAGINPSLAIEYDTWRNSADPTSFDHSSIMLNGNTGNHTRVVPFSSLGNIEDGQWHSVKITWEAATKKFTHVFDGKQLFSINYDIVGNIFSGNPYVYWGFTAATGGAVNLQQVRFSEICSVSENPSPAIAYYDGYNFQNVTGSSQPGQEVKVDQTGNEKMDPPVRGAVEKIVKDLVSLKVVADPDSSAVLGTSNGGSVFGEVFPKGTRKIVTAVPNDQTSIRFESWNSNISPKIAQTSSTTSNVNPYDEFINANTVIFPKFADCGGCCPPETPGKIGAEGDQIIDAGTIPEPINSVSDGTLSISGTIAYQWEISQDGPNTGFTPITGATEVDYVPDSVITDTTWYRRVAINDCNVPTKLVYNGSTPPDYSSSSISNVVQIIVNPVFEAPGGGAIACENDVVIALGDNCEAIISSEAVTRPSFQDQFIYMDATHIPSSFPLNAITTRDSFYGEGTWMYGLYSNTPDEKGLHQLICWGTFRSQDVDVPVMIGDTIDVADDPSTVIRENVFQQYGGLKEIDFLTWRGDLDYDDDAFQPGLWSCWQSTNHALEDFTWLDDEYRTYDTIRIKPSFTGYLSLIAASKLQSNESANEANFDPVIAVYADGFDPLNPCENLLSLGESSMIPNPLAGMGFFEGSTGALSGTQQSLKNIFAPWLLHENPVVRMDIQVQEGKEYVVVITHRDYDIKTFAREDSVLVPGKFGFTLPDQTVQVGDTFCIPVKVQEFDSIVAAEMSIKFNGSLLELVDLDHYASFLTQNDFNTPASTAVPGELSLTWSDTLNAPGQSLSDGDTLFSMCFVALADGAPEVYLSNSPVTYQVIDSSGNVLPFASDYSTVTIGSGVQLDEYRVYDGNFEIYFMRNDYQNSGTITDNATNILFDLEENLLYDTSFSFFDFLCTDLDQVLMNGGVTLREDVYFGGTISELDLYMGGDGSKQFIGSDLSELGSLWRKTASALLSKPGRDTALFDINNLNFGRGSKSAAREFANNLIYNYGFMPMVVDNCGSFEVKVQDSYTEYGDCGIDLGGYDAQGDGSNVAGIITRTFIVKDFSFRANTDTAQIQIMFRNPNLTDLRLPNYTVTLDCDEMDGSIALLDNGLPHPSSTGYPFIPTLTGFEDLTPTNAVCNLAAGYEDYAVVETCSNNKEFRREWTVYDWCRPGTSVIYNQLIRVGDWTEPTFTENSTTITSSYSADECAGVATISRGHATDNCGSSFIDVTVYRDTLASIDNEIAFAAMNDNGSYNAVIGSEGITGKVSDDGSISLEHLPSGSYLVRWVVRDDCGNKDTTHNIFSVADEVAPSCVIDDLRSITLSDFGAIGNETEIESTKERGQAWVTAERLDEGSWDNCGVITDRKVRRMLGEAMTEWADAVAFTCDDEGLSVLVELKVTDDSNNETICWTNIVPVDKTQPECRDIGTVYYSCDELPSGDNLGGDSEVWNRFFDDSITLENVSIEELCGSNIEVFDTESSIDQCGYGWVNRYYKVYRQIDDKEFADSCRMSLVFSENHSYSITFPADEVKECEDLDQDDVIYSEGGCDLITISRVEEKFDASADECYKIFRTFNIINWCEFEEDGSPIQLERLDMDEDGKEGDSYTIHVEYKEKTQHVFWDYQDEETKGDYQNRADRRDTIAREGLVSPDSKVVFWLSGDKQKDSIDFSDYTTSNWDLYWTVASADHSEGYFTYTQVLKVYDDEEPTIAFSTEQDSFPSYSNEEGCPGDVEIVATLGDDCTSDINQVEVTEAYLDAGNDAGSNSDNFEYNVLADIEQADGTVTYKGSDLPAGTHRLRLVARDGCGNVRTEDHVFTVYDAKGPAPLCIEGFAVELMPLEDGQLGVAEVAAKDFLVNSPIADCSGESGTYYITRLLTEAGDQKTADEIKLANTTSMILSCSDKGTLSVAVIATDQSAGKNKDYCITTISVQDNLTPCPEVGELTGIITTEENETVSGVYLQVNGTNLGYERITQADGSFSIGGLEIGSDYTIAPTKTEDLLNGISTFDLVLISKHILGTSLLNSPYKLIAADVNNSGSISTLDLIILRQNLLLQRSDFAGNTSWRFVPTAYSFPVPQNPWSASFPEVININDLQGTVQVDFVAIKVGDVNNSAINDVQQRSNQSFVLSIPNLQVEEGNEYEIEVKGNVSNITGFQTGVKFNGIEMIKIEKALVNEENFNYLESENTVLLSWTKKAQLYAEQSDVTDLVRFTFKAKQNGRLSEMISIDQRNLSAEAYNPGGIIEGVNIEFAEAELAEGATKLMQNLPNPFKQATIVDFYLSEASAATLTITDITGRVVKTINGNYQRGNHRVEITKEELSASGVYYYTLTAGNFVSTRKMVLIE